MANGGVLGGSLLQSLAPTLGQSAPLPMLGNVAVAEQAPLDRQTNLLEAIKKMGLTKEEQNLYWHHLNNMEGGGAVRNPDGSTSTILQMNIEHNGRNYNIPSVWDGKELDVHAAIKRAAKVGWDHWPSYATPDEADSRYMQMHDYMGRDIPHQGWDALEGEDQ